MNDTQSGKKLSEVLSKQGHRAQLEALASSLLEKETLEADEIQSIIGNAEPSARVIRS